MMESQELQTEEQKKIEFLQSYFKDDPLALDLLLFVNEKNNEGEFAHLRDFFKKFPQNASTKSSTKKTLIGASLVYPVNTSNYKRRKNHIAFQTSYPGLVEMDLKMKYSWGGLGFAINPTYKNAVEALKKSRS